MKLVAKRLTNGWTEYQRNNNKNTCDDCGAKLWVAPDGKSLYCDNQSELHEEGEKKL